MPIYAFEDKIPAVSPDAYVHPDAVLIGDVTVEKDCFIAPGVVIRADIGSVMIREGTSVQDNVIIHVEAGSKVVVEKGVLVGHGAVLHDVHIGSGCVIGMSAILLHDAVCEEGAFVGAGSLVPSRMRIPSGKLAAGNPAKIIRDITPEQAELMAGGVQLYVELADKYKKGMRKI